jgi:hypothetical protein
VSDAELEAAVKELAAGLLCRGFWVSPESDWRKWRVHTDGAAAILGVKAKTLANGRSDPSSPWYELPYEPHRSGVMYVIATAVKFDRTGRLDAAA